MDTTEPVYLASFKGTHAGWQGAFNRFTRWATAGAYSHSEVCIGNPFAGEVLCVSSVGVDGGVRGKTFQLDPSEFDIKPMPGVTPDAVRAFLAAHEGHGYDFVGTVLTVLPFMAREHPQKWICSEVAAHIAGLQDPWRFHPTALHCALKGN